MIIHSTCRSCLCRPVFWAEIGHQDRCFWAFQGPFETFLHLDADMICIKSLENLRQLVAQQQILSMSTLCLLGPHSYLPSSDFLIQIHTKAPQRLISSVLANDFLEVFMSRSTNVFSPGNGWPVDGLTLTLAAPWRMT
jgi:hypothetical protein